MKEQIRSLLPEDHPWKDLIRWYDSIDSTNLEARRLALAGAPHGTVLIADHQTGGKGRMGRSFLSPAGMGIYLSVLLRPNCPAHKLMLLTCSAAAAACDAVEAAVDIRPGIKWTNDLVFGKRKLAGILTELSTDPETSTINCAIIGIGINCCQREPDFDTSIRDFAGSLAMAAGKPVDRVRVAAELILSLSQMELTADILPAQYRRDCITLGREISLLRPDGSVRHGKALDVDDLGALLVQFADGSVEAVNSGEISVRGMYGYV